MNKFRTYVTEYKLDNGITIIKNKFENLPFEYDIDDEFDSTLYIDGEVVRKTGKVVSIKKYFAETDYRIGFEII